MSSRKLYSVLLGGFLFLIGATNVMALDRRVVVENNTSYTMREFYASSKGQKSWQEDILGRDMLASGQALRINIDDGTGYCVYDLKAVFENGAEAVQPGVNICEVGTFTFND